MNMRYHLILCALTLTGLAPAQERAPRDGSSKKQSKNESKNERSNPLKLDKTGMRWVMPFAKARALATKQNRVLMIKPVAFGTEASGGW